MRKNIYQKGITLISLIITIVLLIILASVSLNVTLGNNGIFKQSKNSVLYYSESIVREELREKWKSMELILGSKDVTFKEKVEKYVELLKKIDETTKYTIVSDKEVHIYYKWNKAILDEKGNLIQIGIDTIAETPIKISFNLKYDSEDIPEIGENYKVENEAPIPTGFKYVEGTVDTGLVIEDITKNEDGTNTQTTGNQFVWIPVKRNQKIVLEIESMEDIASIKINDSNTKFISSNEERTYDYIYLTGENGNYIPGKIEPNEGTKSYKLTFLPSSNRPYSVTVIDVLGNKVTEEIEVITIWGQDFLELETVTTKYETLEDACEKEGVESETKLLEKYGYTGGAYPYVTLYRKGIYIEEKKIELYNELFEPRREYIKEDGTTATYQYPFYSDRMINVSNIRNSINKYGGFYIARYEAGTLSESEAMDYQTPTDGTVKPLSKAGYRTWRFLAQSTGGWYERAYRLATCTYPNSEENTTGVISSQMSGRDWGRTLYWLLETNSDRKEDILVDSTYWGNYTSIYETGTNDNYQMNNIYDFSGNVWEYTTENTSGSGVSRGSSNYIAKYQNIVKRYSSMDSYLAAGGATFRMVLYLK